MCALVCDRLTDKREMHSSRWKIGEALTSEKALTRKIPFINSKKSKARREENGVVKRRDLMEENVTLAFRKTNASRSLVGLA